MSLLFCNMYSQGRKKHMDYCILYVLTVRCTTEKCEEDLECNLIRTDDESAIYTDVKTWKKSSLMDVEVLEKEKEEIIARVPFVIKEAALVWVRECFMYIKKHGAKELGENVNKEWRRIMDPDYDCRWFAGGKKVEEWREEMRRLAEKL